MLDTVCYRFEEVDTGKLRGVFDKYVEMVYLLTLEGSDRTENAIKRVGAISSRLTVQYNKGCNCAHKNMSIKKSHADLSHALGNIFRHAVKKKYTNILVLEDDFVFDSDYYTREDVNEIGRFISEVTSRPTTSEPYHCSLFLFHDTIDEGFAAQPLTVSYTTKVISCSITLLLRPWTTIYTATRFMSLTWVLNLIYIISLFVSKPSHQQKTRITGRSPT
jgi:hypothetical protein